MPSKVRIYARRSHHLLQWWEPTAGRTCTLRVNSDLLDALSKAREIENRLLAYRRSGQVGRRIAIGDLVSRYLADAAARADAGQLAVSSVNRFRSALGHFLTFVEVPDVARKYQYAHAVDREFVLKFSAWLAQRRITPNGRAGAKSQRPMTSGRFVKDIARSMFEWAADSARGHALPDGFINPFRRQGDRDRVAPRDVLGEPDITVHMAAQFMVACDRYQLGIFLPMLLWGLRPTESIWMFHEAIDGQFLRHECIQQIGYTSKGLRNKSLPFVHPLKQVLGAVAPAKGLILLRREVAEERVVVPFRGASLKELIAEYDRRAGLLGSTSARQRQQIRDAVLHDAGGLSYKRIVGEFKEVAGRLNWPATATLKDFRHLCQTVLDHGGLSISERQYLLGQSMGRAAIVAYTHLNQLPARYRNAVETGFRPVLTAIEQKLHAAHKMPVHRSGGRRPVE